MPNIFFNIKVTAPAITNDIRVSIYDQADPNTVIASQQQNAPHLDQLFSLPGLPESNLTYKIEEALINSPTIVSLLGQANFVPANQTIQYKAPVLIKVGTSVVPGSTSGISSTIATDYLGHPSSHSWAFTLQGTVQSGATVQVNFTYDDGGGTEAGSVTSTVLSGWTLTDLVTDLYNQLFAAASNAIVSNYTFSSHSGVRILGLSMADGNVIITNTVGSQIWPANVNTVTIPDWIGWSFEAYGRVGQYPIKDDGVLHVDSDFDPITGVLTLLQIGDTFQDGEYWYFEFQDIIQTSSGGVGGGGTGGAGFTEILLVTANTVLTAADIGKKILIDPAGNYLEITLPDYTAIAANTITYFEMVSSTSKCARIKCYSGQNISWLQILSDLYIKPNESFELYKRVVSTGVYQWRVQNNCGNFLDVGELFYSDLSTDKIFNAIELDGANVDIQKEARLYNQFVVRNGIAISYADWSSSNIFTRMKFSLKDTASNNFRVPDAKTTPVYLRPLSSGVSAGDYIAQQLAQHQHMQSIGELPSSPFGQTGSSQKGTIGNYNSVGNVRFDLSSRATQFNSATGLWTIIDGTENRPNTRATRLYIKC